MTERLARFARSQDYRALWPGLTEPALAAARRAIERAVRAMLTDETPATLDTDGDAEVYALKVAAYTTGTGALLGRWVEDGHLNVADAVRPLLARELDQGRRRAARIERELLPAVDALLARNITPVALKGFHTARAYCEEPGVRPAADVDLLVPPGRIGAAEEALRASGFEPITARKDLPYKRHWKGVHVDPRTFSVEGVDERNRWEIDLHDSFDRRGIAWSVSLDAERGSVQPFLVAGRPMLAPRPPLLVLVLACQIATELKSMRLMRLIDLVRVIRTARANGKLDSDEVMAHLRHTGAARLAYPAFFLAERLAPATIEPQVMAYADGASNWAIRSTVARLRPCGDSADKTNLMAHFMWARGPVDVLRIFKSLATGGMPLSARAVVDRFRLLVRRIVTGTFSFGRPDETAT